LHASAIDDRARAARDAGPRNVNSGKQAGELLPLQPPLSSREDGSAPHFSATNASYHHITAAIVACAAPHYPVVARSDLVTGSIRSGSGTSACHEQEPSSSTATLISAEVAAPAAAAAAVVPHRLRAVKFFDQVRQLQSEPPVSKSLVLPSAATQSSASSAVHACEGAGAVAESLQFTGTESALEFWQKRLALYRGAAAVGRTVGRRVVLPEPSDA
jgi:hypothetical protein